MFYFRDCPSGWFVCASDQVCINPRYVCDGQPDCDDSSDEEPGEINGFQTWPRCPEEGTFAKKIGPGQVKIGMRSVFISLLMLCQDGGAKIINPQHSRPKIGEI